MLGILSLAIVDGEHSNAELQSTLPSINTLGDLKTALNISKISGNIKLS